MKATETAVFKKQMLVCIGVFALLYLLNSLVISPIMLALSSDVLYSDSPIMTILEYVTQLFELGAICICYAFLLTALYSFKKPRVGAIFVIFCSATAYKYTANVVLSWIFGGSVPYLWVWDIVNIVYYTALELLQLMLIYLFARSIIGRYNDRRSLMERVYRRTGEQPCEKIDKAYPFSSVYDRKNCLLQSAFICAVITFIAKFAGNVFDDAWSILIYGLPSDGLTYLRMAVNYISKIIFGVLAYFVIYGAMSFFLKKHQ